MGDGDGTIRNAGYAHKVVGLKPLAAHGYRAFSESAQVGGGNISRHGVFVGGDAGKLENALDASAVDAAIAQVQEDKTVLRSARNDFVPVPALIPRLPRRSASIRALVTIASV